MLKDFMENTLSNITLPGWLIESLPTRNFSNTLLAEWIEEKKIVEVKDHSGVVLNEFKKLSEAVNFYRNNKSDPKELIFSESFENSSLGFPMGGHSFVENDGLMVFGWNYDDALDIIKSDYSKFVTEIDPEWRADKNNWGKAYIWLDNHPAFWLKNDGSGLSWATSNCNSRISAYVDLKDNENTIVSMEHGQHVPKEYNMHYHDYRLDVEAEDFSSAYVKLAKKVDKFFNIDGTEKKNVNYKKSVAEKQLEKIIKDSEAHHLDENSKR